MKFPDFDKVNTEHGFGLVCRDEVLDFERIFKEGADKFVRNGWRMDDFYVKKLGSDEYNAVPATRFVNSVKLANIACTEKNTFANIPNPIGLIYSGTGADLVARESKGYFIAEYMPGLRVLHEFKNFTPPQQKKFFKTLGMALRQFREQGLFLGEFAPKDLLVEKIDDFNLTFVDTEYVTDAGYSRITAAGALERQIVQFTSDYYPFLEDLQ
ncbi:hypothetical protein KY315_01760, partial [Candidatus Woesearchaeota archaeon]|nr:hypothetical protein [Candidatus Woesearchaeota archaeon]